MGPTITFPGEQPRPFPTKHEAVRWLIETKFAPIETQHLKTVVLPEIQRGYPVVTHELAEPREVVREVERVVEVEVVQVIPATLLKPFDGTYPTDYGAVRIKSGGQPNAGEVG